MKKQFCRIDAKWLITLVTASLATAALAQASTPSYSPVVSFGTLPALQVTTPIPGSLHVPDDFNGDGTSDILWFNPTLSQVGYWTMTATTAGVPFSGGGVTRTGTRTFNVSPGYFVGAVGDFNNDGYADLVFTSANRDLWLWTNDQQGAWASTYIGTYPSEWQLVGAGDINGDGYDDLLWLNPSACEFAYWTMQGAKRTGYKIVPITCGYYPISIGYYSPSNRLSIMWTSPANDLYVWDSTATGGFKSYQLFGSGGMAQVWAIGGGFMGNGMGVEIFQPNPNSGAPNLGSGYGSIYSRTFDAAGNQTGFTGGMEWDGGAFGTWGSGGYLVQSNGVNATGLYAINQASNELVTGGLPGSDIIFSGPAPIIPASTRWVYPTGWWIVGAPANKTAAPPWQ